jgi:type IV pilus assembly protein PilM
MGLPFLSNGAAKRPDQLIAVDLGARTTKAVHLQRRGEGFVLHRYALLDAPIFEKTLSPDLLTEHLRAIIQALECRAKSAVLAVGVNEAFVRHAEMPRMPIEDMRQVLKLGPRNYLQQDLPNHVFDCYVLPPKAAAAAPDAKSAAPQPKFRVLATGTRQQLVTDYSSAVRAAGLIPDHLVPGLIGPANAFELAMPQLFQQEVVALVDLGFRSTTISILNCGEFAMSRVVALGGDRITSGLAENMGISYAEAEGIKVGMATEVQAILESLLSPLGRELRASLDFFEHQQDKPVGQVFFTGGASRSPYIIGALQAEMMVECKSWNPVATIQAELPPLQAAELEQVAPQLSVAVGAALAAF